MIELINFFLGQLVYLDKICSGISTFPVVQSISQKCLEFDPTKSKF